MKIFSSLLLAAFTMLVFSNCKKEDGPVEKTKTELLTSGEWVHESSGADLDKNGTIDLTLEAAGVPQCRLDNRLMFRTDNTAVADEGTTKCNTSDPQTTQFRWQFADNQTTLSLSDNVFTQLNGKFVIRTLSSTQLSMSKDTSIAPFGNVAVMVNMKH